MAKFFSKRYVEGVPINTCIEGVFSYPFIIVTRDSKLKDFNGNSFFKAGFHIDMTKNVYEFEEKKEMAKFTQSDAQIEVKDVGFGKTFRIAQAYGSSEEDVKVDTINLTEKNAREIAYAILSALGER